MSSQPLPVVISPRPRLRQPLITRLLMRPAAVCNHPGPRRAGRESWAGVRRRKGLRLREADLRRHDSRGDGA